MPLASPFPYIVCYDLKGPPLTYLRLTTELQASYAWWHYLHSTWIVLRYEALTELQPKLLPLILKEDRLLILPAKGPAAGWLPKDAWTWIQNSVPREW
jgi:hypothetical protein